MKRIENAKAIFRSRKSRKDRQYNGQRKKDKRTENDLQSTIQKTIDQTPLKPGGEPLCSWRVKSSCSTCGTCRVTLVTYPVICHEWGKDWIVITTNGTYTWPFVTQILVTVNKVMVAFNTFFSGILSINKYIVYRFIPDHLNSPHPGFSGFVLFSFSSSV